MSEIVTDALIIIGAVMVGVGLGWIEWQLALVWAGFLCMAVGVLRLRGKQT